MTWQPHITVAAVVQQAGRFLLVKERSAEGVPVINQPAGHLQEGETLIQALVRETLEETRWRVEPEAILSFNLYTSPSNQVTYFRCNFLAKPITEDKSAVLDKDIEAVLWLSEAELLQRPENLRSPMVAKAIKDFQSGQRYPLSLIQHFIANHEHER
jgi:ADP-ribose pyrophosphatase YjhB (NUDIX family)